MRVLYVTHYGLLEPLGQSQILPYLTGLARQDISIEILSFEKRQFMADRARLEELSKELRSQEMLWFPRRYRRGASLRLLGTDLLAASLQIRSRCARGDIDLLHCRSHVPALMAWPAAIVCRKPFLFDFRGFMAEEYVDSGLWRRNGIRFRLTKAFERILARRSSALVALTDPARDCLQREYLLDPEKLFVIPCCADLARFRTSSQPPAPSPGRALNVVYAGSTGGRYRMAEMLSFFSLLSQARSGSRLTILSNGDLGPVRALVSRAGLAEESVILESRTPGQVPEVLAEQDLGLVFLNGGRALMGASPTKLGEYLACGLAVVAEDSLGDVRRVLSEEEAGCLINSAKRETWPAVLAEALLLCDRSDFRERARRTAAKFFSLEDGVARYARAYEYAIRAARRS
jgi:glycosyltransferase involved in cell wall biosynthesis